MLSKLAIYLILQLKLNVFFLMKFDKFEIIFNIDRSSETLVTLLFLLLKNCIAIREIENGAVHSNDNIYIYIYTIENEWEWNYTLGACILLGGWVISKSLTVITMQLCTTMYISSCSNGNCNNFITTIIYFVIWDFGNKLQLSTHNYV